MRKHKPDDQICQPKNVSLPKGVIAYIQREADKSGLDFSTQVRLWVVERMRQDEAVND